MSDFHQTGVVATLHHLGNPNSEGLERELVTLSKIRPLALVLPSLYSELEGPALGQILDELRQVPYLHEIVISLDRADGRQFEKAREFFSRLPQRHRIIWHDGPRIKEVFHKLKREGLYLGAGNIYETMQNVIGIGDELHPAPMGGRLPAVLFDDVSFAMHG